MWSNISSSLFLLCRGWAKMKRIGSIVAIFLVLISLIGTSQGSVESEGGSWTFAVLCDTRGDDNNSSYKSGINDTVLSAIATAVVKDDCELVLVPGDMINGWWANGSTSYADQFKNWRTAMAPVYGAGIKVYTVRGNHEDGPSIYPPVPPYSSIPDPALKAAYIEAFGGDNPDNGPPGEKDLTYSFSYKNAFFMGFDQYVTPHKVNQAWMDGSLANNSQLHIFVFGHEPAFAINHPDCLAYYSTERCTFWNNIGNAGGQVYFCGHDHLYNRAHVTDCSGNEIYQMVVGSCGAPFKTWNPPYVDGSVVGDYHNDTDCGYILVTIDDEIAWVEWKALEGNLDDPRWITRDRFGLTKSFPTTDNADSSDLEAYSQQFWRSLRLVLGIMT